MIKKINKITQYQWIFQFENVSDGMLNFLFWFYILMSIRNDENFIQGFEIRSWKTIVS